MTLITGSQPPIPVMKQSNVADFVPFHSLGDSVSILGSLMWSRQSCSTTTTEVPNQEELNEILKQFPAFTGVRPPIIDK